MKMKQHIVQEEIVDLLKINKVLCQALHQISVFKPYIDADRKTFVSNFQLNAKHIGIFLDTINYLNKNNDVLKKVEKLFWQKVNNFSTESGLDIETTTYTADFAGAICKTASRIVAYKRFVVREQGWKNFCPDLLAIKIKYDFDTAKEIMDKIRILLRNVEYIKCSVSFVLFGNPTGSLPN